MKKRIIALCTAICLGCTSLPLPSDAAEHFEIETHIQEQDPRSDLLEEELPLDEENPDSDETPKSELPAPNPSPEPEPPEAEEPSESEPPKPDAPSEPEPSESDTTTEPLPEEDPVLAQEKDSAEDTLFAPETPPQTDLTQVDGTEQDTVLPPAAGYIPIEEEENTPSILEEPGIALLADDLPASYITPDLGGIQRQRHNNCWAFSSMYLAEASMKKLWEAENPDYSELHLSWFSYHTPEDPLGGTRGDANGCTNANFLEQGGNLQLAEKILSGWIGAADEKTAPNSEEDNVLANGLDASVAFKDQAHLQNIYHVNLAEDREEAKRLIYDYGGIGISYFSDGEKEYYNSEHNSYYCPKDEKEDHGVAVVGWDDHFPASQFGGSSGAVPEGDGAWYVRNSWGVEGENYYGYFWLSYYDKSLSTTAYSFVFENADNYEHNYQYDGAMASKSAGYGTKSVSIANVFQVRSGAVAEAVKAVSFFTHNANLDYTVQIYKNPVSAEDPESGTLVEEAGVQGRTSFQGYYTVPLGAEVRLAKGERFSVVITFSKESENVSFVTEASASSWYTSTAQAQEGESFCKAPGGKWTDYGKGYNANIRIKAFTEDTTIPLEKISIENADDRLPLGASRNLSVTYEPYNTTDPRDITWSSSDESVISVSAEGEIKAVSCGDAEITATTGAVSASRSITVYHPDPDKVEPVLTSKSITLNRYGTRGTPLGLLEVEGNRIQAVQIEDDRFMLEKDAESGWLISLNPEQAGNFTKKTVISRNLRIETDLETYTKELKITINVSKPSVSLKNTGKLNVFYVDGTATYRFSGNYAVESVEWESLASPGTQVKPVLEAYTGGEITFSAPGLHADNYAAFLKGSNNCRKGILTVHFSGFDKEADQRISLTVAAQNVKPSFTTSPSSTEVYPSWGVDRGYFRICDTKEKTEISLDGYRIACPSYDMVNVQPRKEQGDIELSYSGTRSIRNLKLELKNDGWTQKVILSHRITAAAAPGITLSSKTVTLNQAVMEEPYAPVMVQAFSRGNGMRLTDLKADPDNEWIRDGVLACTYDPAKGGLYVRLMKLPAKGKSKKLKLLGTMVNASGIQLDKEVSVSLTVKISTGPIRVRLTSKSALNLLERDNPQICKPTVSGLTDHVTGVALSESSGNENLFRAELNDAGQIEIRVQPDASLAAGKKYRLNLDLTLSSGYTVTQSLNVKPSQKNPKLLAPVTKATLYKGTGQTVSFPVAVSGGVHAVIEQVIPVGSAHADAFTIGAYDGEKVNVSLKRGIDLKPGVYTLGFEIQFDGKATNRKPMVKKMKVTVRER